MSSHCVKQLENEKVERVKSHNRKRSEIRCFVNLPLIRLALPGALMPAAPSVAIVAIGWIGGWEQSSHEGRT